MVEEIISRLPVRSVLRFLCISTHWHSLISSPHFILHHLRRASSNPRLLGGSAHYPYNLDPDPISLSHPLRSLIDNPTFNPPLFLHPPLKFGPIPQIIGSVNGMICHARYITDNNFQYYNPATGGRATSPSIRHAMVIDFAVMHGFGYDPLSNTYKTVVIECDTSGYNEDAVVKVYTLGSPRSWKRINLNNRVLAVPAIITFDYNGLVSVAERIITKTVHHGEVDNHSVTNGGGDGSPTSSRVIILEIIIRDITSIANHTINGANDLWDGTEFEGRVKEEGRIEPRVID